MSLEEFKKNVYANSISGVIISGRPMSKEWSFSSFLLNDPQLLEHLFGLEAYEIYENLTNEEKAECIKWFEIHGIECTNMYGGEFHEDLYDRTIPKRDLKKLKNLYPDIYKLVVIKFVKKVFSCYPNDIHKIIIDKYANDCNIFEEEIKMMTKKL